MARGLNSVSANEVIKESAALILASGSCAWNIALIASTSFWDFGVGCFCAINAVSKRAPANRNRFMKTPEFIFSENCAANLFGRRLSPWRIRPPRRALPCNASLPRRALQQRPTDGPDILPTRLGLAAPALTRRRSEIAALPARGSSAEPLYAPLHNTHERAAVYRQAPTVDDCKLGWVF